MKRFEVAVDDLFLCWCVNNEESEVRMNILYVIDISSPMCRLREFDALHCQQQEKEQGPKQTG